MAYSTGSATGLADLLDKIKTFIEANGWINDAYTVESTGRRLHAHHANGNYVNFRTYINETPNAAIGGTPQAGAFSLAFNLGTGYSGATAWYSQAGVPVGVSTRYQTAGFSNVTGAIPSYHFFAHNSGADIFIVIESASGFWQYLGLGSLTKFGTWTGGAYFFGAREGVNNHAFQSGIYASGIGIFSGNSNAISLAPRGYVNVTVDAESGWHWGEINNNNRLAARRFVLDNYAKDQNFLVDLMPASINGLTALSPVVVFSYRDANNVFGTSPTSPLGVVPQFFYTSIQAFTPGQQITFGGENFRIFPFYAKGTAQGAPTITTPINSAYYAYAIKE